MPSSSSAAAPGSSPPCGPSRVRLALGRARRQGHCRLHNAGGWALKAKQHKWPGAVRARDSHGHVGAIRTLSGGAEASLARACSIRSANVPGARGASYTTYLPYKASATTSARAEGARAGGGAAPGREGTRGGRPLLLKFLAPPPSLLHLLRMCIT